MSEHRTIEDEFRDEEIIFDLERRYPNPKTGDLVRFVLTRSELRKIEAVFQASLEYAEFLKLAESVKKNPDTKLDSINFREALRDAISSVKGSPQPYYGKVLLELISKFLSSNR